MSVSAEAEDGDGFPTRFPSEIRYILYEGDIKHPKTEVHETPFQSSYLVLIVLTVNAEAIVVRKVLSFAALRRLMIFLSPVKSHRKELRRAYQPLYESSCFSLSPIISSQNA